jgi:hypothetical protein
MRVPRRLATLALSVALLAMALAVSAARLDLDDDDDSGVQWSAPPSRICSPLEP